MNCSEVYMSKGTFYNIGKLKQQEKALDAFVESAKIDGSESVGKLKSRRGKYRIDPKTGERIDLGGKVLEVPLNAGEVALLSRAAEVSGLPVATFMRSEAVKVARKILGYD
ncbi:hypothetical protein [Sodalis phage phiSG1]|uniref:hypothetical protein n=1 Tax=Sodalis phage phiSG1 TaxID=373126 RepID=UPI00006C5C11|nr:hypothetical protein SGPHI_0047 [Sodalis phage phiSG1]BAE80510.1 hypothetical protein [Sodalis phage phiSG1]